MKEITPAARRVLRARAHHLHPVVMLGEDGLTSAVLHEIDVALRSHELVKIRVLGDERQERAALLGRICGDLDAAPVQIIGKILVLFRPRPVETPAARKSGPKRRRVPRRTKRSHQM